MRTSRRSGCSPSFCPRTATCYPLSFVLEEPFFARPPRCCDVYRYGCGADVYAARFAPREGGHARARAGARAGELLVTVLAAGGQAQAALDGGGGSALDAPACRRSDYEIAEALRRRTGRNLHADPTAGKKAGHAPAPVSTRAATCAFDAPVTAYEGGRAR